METAGAPGATITVRGAGLNDVSTVEFNGVSATFTSLTASELTATVPTGATTGPLKVISPQATVTPLLRRCDFPGCSASIDSRLIRNRSSWLKTANA